MWYLINEYEQDFSSRLNDAVYRCGNFHGELDKMKLFVELLAPTTRTIVANFRENEPHHELKFYRLVQYDQVQGDSYRAQRVGTWTSPALPTWVSKPAREDASRKHFRTINSRPSLTLSPRMLPWIQTTCHSRWQKNKINCTKIQL